MIGKVRPGAQVTAVHRQQPWGNGFEVLNAGRASPQLALTGCFAKQVRETLLLLALLLFRRLLINQHWLALAKNHILINDHFHNFFFRRNVVHNIQQNRF